MQDKANCSKETIDSLKRMLDSVEKDIEAAMDKKDSLIRMIGAEAGKTFMYEGQIYQVCERYNKEKDKKVPFFKKLKKWPKSWLDIEARSKRGLNQEERSLGESAQVDVVESIGALPSSDPMSLNKDDTSTLGVGAHPAVAVID